MTKKIVVIVILFIFSFNVGLAQQTFVQPLQEAHIKYSQLSWQTYEFYVVSTLPDHEGLNYEWTIDNKDIYLSEKVRYFFDKGEHVIKLKVEDQYGNVRYDTVRLNIQFWSLKNNWFWWVLYTIIILIIVYYWIAKLVYLFNRRKVSREARYFLDLLDEHGWVERLVKDYIKTKIVKKQKSKKAKKQ